MLQSMQNPNRNAPKQSQVILDHPPGFTPNQPHNQTQYPPYGLPPSYTPHVNNNTNPHASTSNLQNQTQHQNRHFENNDALTFIPPLPLKPQTTNLSIQHQLEFDYSDFNVTNLCLIPNVVIPPKFKLPEFNKYKGNTCLKNHLTKYCRKMVSHAHDDNLLIHFFSREPYGGCSQAVHEPRAGTHPNLEGLGRSLP
ncbi:hypothetical protein CR513_50513, partial [Mucuna pruriens]